MSGYVEYSKSVNAVLAERDGLMTATQASKYLGVSSAAIKHFLTPDEWHHTSKMYNETSYYRILADDDYDDYDDEVKEQVNNVQALVPAMKSWDTSRRKDQAKTYVNCQVAWIEWTGTKSRPKPKDRLETGCNVMIKGATAIVALPDGSKLTKRLATRGFIVKDESGNTITAYYQHS